MRGSKGPGRSPKPERRLRTDWSALGAFALTGALGPLLGWVTSDLVWGLLLTSFAACVVGLALGIQSAIRLWLPRLFAPWPDQKAGTLVLLLVGSFMVGIGLLMLGGAIVLLHLVYVFLVYDLFPFWAQSPGAIEPAPFTMPVSRAMTPPCGRGTYGDGVADVHLDELIAPPVPEGVRGRLETLCRQPWAAA